MKSIEKIQNLLPLGYLLLVVLGIIKESVFFLQMGINILKYSSIMDVLISPIATLTSNLILLGGTVLMFIFHFYLPKMLYKRRHKKWVEEMFELRETEEELSDKELKNHFLMGSVKILSFALLALFLGIGLGEGIGVSKKIKHNKLSYDYKLNYNTGESEEIAMIGSNSLYYFYLSKGNPSVKIAPVSSIKSIEITKNKMLR